VIRIRYRDFSAGTHDVSGLHGFARRGARGVTVYLVPGLTVRERKAVLRRLRQEAGRGFGPPLPLLALAFALFSDRVRTTAGTGTSLIRLHPAVTLLPGAFLAAVMTLFVLASASRSVDFTPETGQVPQVGGLALSPVIDQRGSEQAPPVWDGQLIAVDDNAGTAHGSAAGQGGAAGQPLGQGKPAHGKCAHGRCAKGRASGHGKAKGGNGSSGKGNGKANGWTGSGPRLLALPPKCSAASPAGCSASVRPASVHRSRRDCEAAGSAGLGTVKGGVGVGDHRR
jgi:hypothetical protein